MIQDSLGCKSPGGHDCGADLAESHSVSPASAMKDKMLCYALYNECTAVKMTPGEPTPDLEFLSHNNASLRADDSQPGDPPRRPTVEGDDLLEGPKIKP